MLEAPNWLEQVKHHRFARYVVATLAAVAAGQGLLAVGYDLLRWPAVLANLVAAIIVTGPAFVLNRSWVWKLNGRANLLRETAPFWLLALIGLAASTGGVALAQHVATAHLRARDLQTMAVVLGSLVSYGVVWIARYLILDRYVFHSVAASQAPLRD